MAGINRLNGSNGGGPNRLKGRKQYLPPAMSKYAGKPIPQKQSKLPRSFEKIALSVARLEFLSRSNVSLKKVPRTNLVNMVIAFTMSGKHEAAALAAAEWRKIRMKDTLTAVEEVSRKIDIVMPLVAEAVRRRLAKPIQPSASINVIWNKQTQVEFALALKKALKEMYTSEKNMDQGELINAIHSNTRHINRPSVELLLETYIETVGKLDKRVTQIIQSGRLEQGN